VDPARAEVIVEFDDTIGSEGQEAHFWGTPQFMAPEQLEARPDVDQRADIYALGAILFFALSGRNLFESESLPRLLMSVWSNPPPKLRATLKKPQPYLLEIGGAYTYLGIQSHGGSGPVLRRPNNLMSAFVNYAAARVFSDAAAYSVESGDSANCGICSRQAIAAPAFAI